ncbi:MAG: ribosome silencing factor [bacterium]
MEKLNMINEYLEKVGAQDIKVFDLRGVSSLFDYVFIATVDVARQAAALVDYINKAKKTNECNLDFRNINGEGSNWTLIDLNDILLNVFTYEERIHYDLERLYVDMPLITLSK